MVGLIHWSRTRHMSILRRTHLATGNYRMTQLSNSSTTHSTARMDVKTKRRLAMPPERALHQTKSAELPTITAYAYPMNIQTHIQHWTLSLEERLHLRPSGWRSWLVRFKTERICPLSSWILHKIPRRSFGFEEDWRNKHVQRVLWFSGHQFCQDSRCKEQIWWCHYLSDSKFVPGCKDYTSWAFYTR